MSEFDGLTDEQLLAATPKRPAAFDVFYVRHERIVLAYFRRRVASAEVAIDLTSETFVAALGSVKRFKPAEQPAIAWLFGIARHKLLRSFERGRVEDKARRKLAMPRVELNDDDLDRVDALGVRPAAELLALLTPEQAEAVRVRVLDEASYAEVARRLNCSELVARKRVSRGLSTLRVALEEER